MAKDKPNVRFVVADKPPEPRPTIVRFKVVQDGDDVDLIGIDDTGEKLGTVLYLRPGKGICQVTKCFIPGLPRDDQGRVVVVQ